MLAGGHDTSAPAGMVPENGCDEGTTDAKMVPAETEDLAGKAAPVVLPSPGHTSTPPPKVVECPSFTPTPVAAVTGLN